MPGEAPWLQGGPVKSLTLVKCCMETAGGIAGSKSPMVSRGTVRIESGEGSPPKPAGERGGGGGGGDF